MEKEFNYVIGYQYDGGGICTYMIHSHDVFHGTREDAENTLNEVKCESKRDVEWKIFIVTELEN